MLDALQNLRLVELDALLLHEECDGARLLRLAERVQAEGFQRNPVIVAQHGGRHLVLDGAHRVSALKELGCRLALVQVVRPGGAAESWGHLLDAASLRRLLKSTSGIEASGAGSGWVAEVQFAGGERLWLRARDEGVVPAARAMRELQRAYPDGEPVRRVAPAEEVEIPEGAALVRYRRFSLRELTGLVERGEVLPAGITRFVIPDRVLNVCLPLVYLKGGSLEERNRELREFIEDLERQGRIRRYSEPVILFE